MAYLINLRLMHMVVNHNITVIASFIFRKCIVIRGGGFKLKSVNLTFL